MNHGNDKIFACDARDHLSMVALHMVSAYWLLSILVILGSIGVTAIPFCVNQQGYQVSAVVELIEFGLIAVRLSDPPAFGTRCGIRVTKWVGEILSTPANYWMSSCSGTMLINSTDFNAPFVANEDCEFSLVSTDALGVELCGSLSTEFTIPSLDCNSGLLLSRPDAVSVIARFPPVVFNSGLCKVWISGFNQYQYDAPNIIESGGCHDDFVFESDRQNISLLAGSNVSFGYSYMFDGVHTECNSAVQTFTLAAPSCSQPLTVVKSSGSSIQIGIISPQPLEGTCSLILLGCEGASPLASGISIEMPSCRRAYDISFSSIQTLLPSAIPGQTCTFSWSYNYGASSCQSADILTTPPVREICSLSEPRKEAGYIILSPSMTTTLSGGSCQVALLGCDGQTLDTPVVKYFVSCDYSEAVEFSASDNSIISADSTCFFELQQLPAGHVFGQSSEYACSSGPVSFTTSTLPRWTVLNDMTLVTLYGSDCVQVSWQPVQDTGGSPVLCYLVWRQEGSGRWYLIQDCGQSKPGSLSLVSCRMITSVPIQFKIYAMNRNGISQDPVFTDVIRFEYFLAAPASVLVSPVSSGPYLSGSLPQIAVQAMHPVLPDPVSDTDTLERIFVAQLTRSVAVDEVTGNGLNLNASLGESGFTVHSSVLTADLASPGTYYSAQVPDFIPEGEYTVVVSSLESGGLRGEYWTNVFFQGIPDMERKDRFVDFEWTDGPILNLTTTQLVIYDLVSIRWTGFLKPLYSEIYNFTFVTRNYLRVWLDHDLVVDSWTDRCGSACWFTKELNSSHYYSLRIDFYVSRGFGQTVGGDISFYWESFSQTNEVVPSSALFKSAFVQNGELINITVIPDLLSAARPEVLLPNRSVVAGEAFSIFIQARDEFGQKRRTAIEDFFACTLTSDAASFTALSMAVNASEKDGFYEVLFLLTVAGSYRVSVADVNGNLLPNQTVNVTVVPGPAEEIVASTVTVQTEKIANQSVVVTAVLRDEFGNTLNGSIPEFSMPKFRLGIKWDFDAVSLDRLGANYHDNLNRTRTFGMTFVSLSTSWDAVNGTFVTSVLPLLSGSYNEVELTLPDSQGLFSPVLLSPWTVEPSPTVSGNNSVVSTNPFPPSNMVAGEPISCVLQLRDGFKNVIDVEPSGLWQSSPVRIRLYRIPDILKEESCLAKAGVHGVYECTIVPSGSGPMEISVLVNGEPASTIPDQSGGAVPIITGPWPVIVSPAPLDPLQTIVYRLRPSYLINDAPNGEMIILFRDSMGNLIEDLRGYRPNITVEFLRLDSSVAMTVHASTFEFEADGSVTVVFFSNVPSGPATPWTLVITVDGTQVPIPHPLVEFKGAPPLAATSSCTVYAWPAAGQPFSVYCTMRDWLGNSVDQSSGLYVKMEAVLNDFGTPLSYFWDAFYDPSSSYIGTTSLSLAGNYQIYARLGQAGGLIAKYYADASFSNLVFPSGAPMSDGQILYSKIDLTLEPRWDGAMVAGNVFSYSVEWIGWLLPPAAVTVRLFIEANGGLRLRLGQAVLIDQLGNTGKIQTTLDHTFISLQPEEIYIQYVPFGAKFSMKWQFPDLSGGNGFSIPKSALLAPLAMPIDNQIITLSEGLMSASSRIAVPVIPFIQNTVEFFTIQAMDNFGNKVSEMSNCLSGSGVSPACLFDIFLDQPDGTPTPTVSFINDGVYRVDITFAASGRKLVHVHLITGPDPSDRVEIAGSPFHVTVNNA